VPRSVAQEERQRKWRRMVRSGIDPHNAGRLVGVAPQTVTRWMALLKADQKLGPEPEYDDAVHPEAYSEEAQRALADFGYFRRRYMGRVTMPWQEEAAYRVVEYLDTPTKEYVVSNAPPGGGKSTLYTHDIPAWLIARKRSIRIMLGSRTERMAFAYSRRLRRTLERTRPVRADHDDILKGLAMDAEATMVGDFGRFKPLNQELWRADEFMVANLDDEQTEDKEATVAAYGLDSGFLGGRFDYVVWDDLIDKKTVKNVEAMDALVGVYESECETRVEPGGCLVLNGQRMKAEDLYHYCLTLSSGDDEDTPKYHHIKFKAHYEEKCEGHHEPDAPPWPEGCLLDPKRIPWKDQAALIKNKPGMYRVVFQQEDVDPERALVQPEWIEGTDGFPGCWDDERYAGVLPIGVPLHECLSIATVDPSPTKFWAIEWIVWHPQTDIRWLVDIERKQMEAPELLDYNVLEQQFSGIMEEWQVRSAQTAAPITTWVVESNVAQRFMLQYTWFRLWQVRRGVQVIPHQTAQNKADPKLGVETIGPIYKKGRMRLPRRGSQAVHVMVSELLRYGWSRTDDTVMAHWFFEFNKDAVPMPNLDEPVFNRPSWMAGAQRGLVG